MPAANNSYSIASGASLYAGRSVPLPAWRVGLAQWAWTQITGSSMNGVNPTSIPAGSTGPSSRINAYCGLIVDRATGRIWSAANGGHGDYAGNEVVLADLRDDAPGFAIIRQPTASVTANVGYFSDGRPNSHHSYNSGHFVSSLGTAGKLVHVGLQGRYSDGGSSGITAVWDIAGNDWDGAGTDQNASPVWPASGVTTSLGSGIAQDQSNEDIYFVGASGLRRFNAATSDFTTLAQPDGYNSDYSADRPMAYDHTRGRAIVLGDAYAPTTGGLLWTANGGTGTWQTITLGSSDFAGANGFGAEYDADLDRIVVATGSAGQILLVHPTTYAVSEQATTGGGSIPAATNGVRGRFRKVDSLGGYLYYPAYTSDIWFLATE